MQYTKKITIILISIITIVLFINASVFAVDNPDSFDPSKNPANTKDNQTAVKIIGKILATIKVIGICLAVIMLTIIGLKYMFGSLEEKANYKENIIPYIAGCFLLASATTIPSIVYDLVNK